jgi:predicted PurR-regulated permease PerM
MKGELEPFSRRVLGASGIVAAVALCVAVVVFEGRALLLLLTGVLFALSLGGASAWIARHTGVPYGVVLAIAVLAVASFLMFGSYSLGAGAVAQAHAFAEEIPKAWESMLEALRHQPGLRELTGAPGAPPKEPAPLEPRTLLGGARAAIGGIGEVLGGAVVVFFIGVYGAARPGDYPRVALQLVPPRYEECVGDVLRETGTYLRRWMLGRLVAMTFVGVFATSGLLVLEVPLAVPLGVLAGLLTFVEYLGAVASAAPACLIAFTAGPLRVVEVLGLYTVAYLIEGYGLTPFLTKKTVSLLPAYTLASQAVLGSIYGVAGLALATPVVIVLTVAARRFYVQGVLGHGSTGGP